MSWARMRPQKATVTKIVVNRRMFAYAFARERKATGNDDVTKSL